MSQWKKRVPYLCTFLGIVVCWTIPFVRYLTIRLSAGTVFYGYDKVSLLVQVLILLAALVLLGFHWDRETLLERFRRRPAILLTYLMIVTAYFVFYDYITASRFLVFQDIGGDTTQEYLPVLNMIVAKIKACDWSWWTSTWGWGIDISNAQSLVFDPFNLPLYFLGTFVSNQVMVYGICLNQIAKCFLCGYFTYLFLSQFSFNPWAKVIASYISAFNGFLMLWGQHYFFASGCVALMLIIWLLERSFHNAKTYPFLALALALTAAFSLYVTYMIGLFCVVYGVVRLVSLQPRLGKKESWKVLLQFAVTVTAAVLLSGVITLPAYYQLTEVTSRTDVSIWRNIISTLVLPSKTLCKYVFLRFFSNNLLGTAGNYAGFGNYYELIQMFFSCLCPAILTLFFAEGILYSTGIRKRLRYLLLLLVFVASFTLPLISLLFNKFVATASRYSFIYMPFIAYVIAFTLSRIRSLHPVSFWIAWAVTLLSAALILKMSTLRQTEYVYATAGLVVAGMAALSFAHRWKQEDFISMAAVCLVVGMSVSADGFITTSVRGTWTRDSNLVQDGYSTATTEALREIRQDADGFYRVEKAYYDVSLWNESLTQNYSGVSYYNTTYNRFVQNFIRETWLSAEYNPDYEEKYTSFWKDPQNAQMASLFGIRYIVARDHSLDGTPGYQLWWDSGKGSCIYKNTEAGGLGILFDRQMSESSFLSLSAETRQKALADCVVTNKTAGNVSTYASGDLLTGKYDYADNAVSFTENGNSGSLSADVTVDSEKLLFLSIPYDAGWTVRVNGEKAEVYKANLGFQAVVLEPGASHITCTYSTPMLKEGIAISAVGVVVFVLLVCLPVKRRWFVSIEK